MTFNEAYNYSPKQMETLLFTSFMLQILSLEYLMGRNNAKGQMILKLEDTILPGAQYWVKKLSRDEKLDYRSDLDD